jgi:STE24 endopeptidase
MVLFYGRPYGSGDRRGDYPYPFTLYVLQYVYIRNVYRKTASPEIALNRLRLLNQYVYNIMAVLSLLFQSLLIAFQLFQGLEADDLFLFYGFTVALLVMGPLLLLKQYMASHLIKRIRATEKTRKDALIESVLGIAVRFLPIFLVLVIFVVWEWLPFESFLVETSFLALAAIAAIVLIYAVLPFLIEKKIKKGTLPKPELKDELLALFARANVKNVKLYVFSGKKDKIANALVMGFFKKKIWLADTLFDHFTADEIKGILAHEIGHIKGLHIWVRLGLAVLFSALLVCLANNERINNLLSDISDWAFLLLLLMFAVLLILIMRLVYRMQERSADRYVLKLGINYRDYALALWKLAEYNHMKTNLNKADETFQTHPSIARRIKWIIKEANGSIEELKALQAGEESLTIPDLK